MKVSGFNLCFLWIKVSVCVYFMENHKVTFQRTFNDRCFLDCVLSGSKNPHAHERASTHSQPHPSHSDPIDKSPNLNIHGSSTFCIHSNPLNYISLSIITLLSAGCVWKSRGPWLTFASVVLAAHIQLHTRAQGVEKTQPVPFGVNSSRALDPCQTISYHGLLMGLPQCLAPSYIVIVSASYQKQYKPHCFFLLDI